MTAQHERDFQNLTEAIKEQLIPIIEKGINGYGLAGLGVGIVKDGKMVLAEGYGCRNIETGEPVTDRSLFHLASVSKPFVATAIMQLWEGGQLDLDESVAKYLPYFRLKTGNFDQITIRHLLSHTGGVPDSEAYFWHQPESDDGALERYARSLSDEKMIAIPGERYAYSNPAYEVLGDLIAKVSGQTFESYVKSHILEPLGMVDSTFLRREVPPELATTPHFGAPLTVLAGAYPYNRAHAPSSTLHSSAADMCRWTLANLSRGTLNGRRILRENSYETLWHPTAVTGEETWSEVSCLGWFRGTYRSHPVVHHGGSDPGYFADLVLMPELQLGVIVMANAYCATAWGITDATLDIALGLEPAVPKCPIAVPVGQVLRSQGQKAAVAEFRRLQTEAADQYDFEEDRFTDAIWGAVEVHQPEAVVPLLNLRAALFPQSSGAFEWLGRAHVAGGDPDAAAANLQRALKLEPDNEDVQRLLRQLKGAKDPDQYE